MPLTQSVLSQAHLYLLGKDLFVLLENEDKKNNLEIFIGI